GALFVVVERRTAQPLLDVSVFGNSRFSIGALVIMVAFTAQAGSMYLGAQYLQNVLAYNPLEAGLAVLPLGLTVLLVAPRGVAINARWGSRKTVTAGLLVMAAGFVLVRFWGPTSPYPVIAITYVVLAAGLALAMTPATNLIMGSLPHAKAGIGSAVNDVTRDMGSALGIAVFGTIVTIQYTRFFEQAFTQLSPEQAARISGDIAATISDSLGGALAVAAAYPGAMADKVVAAARDAWLAGQDLAMVTAIGMVLILAAIVWLRLRDVAPAAAGDPLS
ncbi:MAG: MFS transporter, partial [Chloroflexota bacterium]